MERDQKCIHLLGAKIPLICLGRQSTSSQESRYRPENGNKRKLGWTYRHGTMFAPRQYLYQKEATGIERPEIFFHYSVQKHLLLVQAIKLPRLRGLCIGP